MSGRIAVVGCGIAGLTAALCLSRRGREVDLYERFETAQPTGAGFLLQPTGMGVLAALGLDASVRAQGAVIDRLHGETIQGRQIMDLPYADYRVGYHGLGVHRGVVFQALYDAVLASPQIRLRAASEVSGATRREGGVRLEGGFGAEGPYPLVVAADGVNSSLRRALGVARRDRAYDWACLWSIAPDPGGQLDGALASTLDQRYEGTARFAGILPIGRAPEWPDRQSAALFWSLPARRFRAWRAAGLARWKLELFGFWPRFAGFIDAIDDPERITLAVYRDVVLERPDHGRVVFIGDAGHAMSPQLGQGANLAMLDAWALAEAVAATPDVEQALARFAAARRRQLWWYQTASRWLTPLFQSSRRFWAVGRDLAFGPVSRIGPLRREMLAAQAGMKTGLFSQDRRDWTPGRRPDFLAALPPAAPVSPPIDPSGAAGDA